MLPNIYTKPDMSEQLITEIRVPNARIHTCCVPICRIQTFYQGCSTKARRRPHILQSIEFYYTFSRSNANTSCANTNHILLR